MAIINLIQVNTYFQQTWNNLLPAILVLVLCLTSSSCTKNKASLDILPDGLKDSYVSVLPFKNNTGKTELDALGEMAADWITQGLSESGEGKVISANHFNQDFLLQSIAKESTNNFDSSSDIHFIIEGTYYKVDSALMFSSNIKKVDDGEIVFAFPMIEGTEQEVMQLVEKLKQRILGFWVTKDIVDYKRKPPNYEAYKAFLEGIKLYDTETYNAGLLFEKAMLLDSSFHLATIWYARSLSFQNQREKADSIRTVLEQNINQLGPIELLELRFFEARITRNKNLFWRQLQTEKKPFYVSKSRWHWYKANTLMNYFNQNDKALESLQNIDLSSLDYKLAENGYTYIIKVISYYNKGEYEKATEMAVNPPFEMSFLNNWFPLIRLQLMLLAKMKAYEELDERLEHYHNSQPVSVPYPKHFLRFTAIESMFSADPKMAEIYALEYLRFLKEENNDKRTGWNGLTIEEVTCALFLAIGQPKKIKELIQKGTGLDDSKRHILALKGIYYAQMKNEIKAREMISASKELIGNYNLRAYDYNSAIIESWLGNKQLACTLLEDAQQKGFPFFFTNFAGDWRLQPLFDYPDFKNKVLAPIPLPELDIPSDDKSKISKTYWIYVFGLMLSAYLVYFLTRRKRQQNIEQDVKIIETKIDLPETKEDEFLIKLKSIIEEKMAEGDISMPQLCRALGYSRAQIYRKIKVLTGKSPSLYIRSFRLQIAKVLLKDSELNISEIGYEVGFKDLSYFSRSFTEEYGMSPSEMRKKTID